MGLELFSVFLFETVEPTSIYSWVFPVSPCDFLYMNKKMPVNLNVNLKMNLQGPLGILECIPF